MSGIVETLLATPQPELGTPLNLFLFTLFNAVDLASLVASTAIGM